MAVNMISASKIQICNTMYHRSYAYTYIYLYMKPFTTQSCYETRYKRLTFACSMQTDRSISVTTQTTKMLLFTAWTSRNFATTVSAVRLLVSMPNHAIVVGTWSYLVQTQVLYRIRDVFVKQAVACFTKTVVSTTVSNKR